MTPDRTQGHSPVYCPACGVDVAATDRECPLCGTALSHAAARPARSPHPPESGDPAGGLSGTEGGADLLACGACGHPVSPEHSYCAECGADLRTGHEAGDRAGAERGLHAVWDGTDGPGPARESPWQEPVAPPRRTAGVVLAIVAAVLVVGLGAALTIGLLGGSDRTPSAAPSPLGTTAQAPTATTGPPATSEPSVTVTVTTTATAAGPGTPTQRLYHRASGIPGHFSEGAGLTESTSAPFVRAVAEEYARSGANGGSLRLRAFSETTGKFYDMDCVDQGDRTVVCSGGRNARIILWDVAHDSV